MAFLKSNYKDMSQVEIQFSLIKASRQMSKQNVRVGGVKLPAAGRGRGTTARCVSVHNRGAAGGCAGFCFLPSPQSMTLENAKV